MLSFLPNSDIKIHKGKSILSLKFWVSLISKIGNLEKCLSPKISANSSLKITKIG